MAKLSDKILIGGFKLCTPVYVYLVISVISFLMMIGMNLSGASLIGFVLKVLIWSFILNVICNSGYTSVSWFLVLLPFILMFIFVLFFTTGMALEAGKAAHRQMGGPSFM
jgi:hypothetical protein